MAPSRARGKRAQRGTLARSLRDPCGKLAGTFRDGSRTVRGRFEDVAAAEARSDHAGDPVRWRGTLRCASALGGVRWSTGRAAASRWSVERVWVHALMAKPFRGVHLNPARQRAVPSQVHSHRFRHPRVNR